MSRVVAPQLWGFIGNSNRAPAGVLALLVVATGMLVLSTRCIDAMRSSSGHWPCVGIREIVFNHIRMRGNPV